jgi:uncharacterized membrane protein YjfL (UPF0719 family)
MDANLIIIAGYEVVISLLCGLFTIFVSLRLLERFLAPKQDGGLPLKRNSAVALFTACMLLAELLLVRQSVLPAVDALRTMVGVKHELTGGMVMLSLGYFMAFYLITLVISLCCLYLSIGIYTKATVEVDEISEIAQNNLAVSILLSAVVLGLSWFIQAPVERLVGSLVNYESLGKIEVMPTNMGPGSEKLFYVPKE